MPLGLKVPSQRAPAFRVSRALGTPGVLEVEAERRLGDVEVRVAHVPEEDARPRGVAAHEIGDGVEVVAAVRVPGEVLAEVVLAEVETEADLVVPREEREALLDLELLLVHVDRQPPRLAERAERRLEDPEVRLERTVRKVRQPVEIVVGVLDAELVDAGVTEQRDHRADQRVGPFQLP